MCGSSPRRRARGHIRNGEARVCHASTGSGGRPFASSRPPRGCRAPPRHPAQAATGARLRGAAPAALGRTAWMTVLGGPGLPQPVVSPSAHRGAGRCVRAVRLTVEPRFDGYPRRELGETEIRQRRPRRGRTTYSRYGRVTARPWRPFSVRLGAQSTGGSGAHLGHAGHTCRACGHPPGWNAGRYSGASRCAAAHGRSGGLLAPLRHVRTVTGGDRSCTNTCAAPALGAPSGPRRSGARAAVGDPRHRGL
jgi:hypothetical protein